MRLTPRRFRILALAAVVLLSVLVALPNLAAAPGGFGSIAPPGHASSIALNIGAVYSGSFASRAGFEDWYSRSTSHVTPATGALLVVVTFRPSDPSFFSPPPLGSHALSLAQIAERYGLAPATYASAESYFESMGLTVVHPWEDRLTLTVGGDPATVSRAFGTQLESGMYEGRAVTFPSIAPSLPASLESSVAAVTGLSSGFVPFSLPAGLPAPRPSPATGPAVGPNDLMTPAIAREVYDLSSLYNVSGPSRFATGQGIALLLWGWGYSPGDIASFFSNDYPAGFPQPSIHPHPVDGAPSPSSNAVFDPSKAPQELTLDMEWAGSMAPGAAIHAVYAPDGPAANNYSPTDASMGDALNEAVSIPGISVISMSFGTPESSSQGLAALWATDFAAAAQEGITLLAATGDFGGDAASGCTGGPSPEFPSTSPDVIAVGGTAPTLARNLLGQVTGLASEPAWSGSGGGFSTLNAAPSWQEVGSAAAPILANGHRGTPDVSATAAYNFLHYNGSDGVAAGTSFATPLWGGLVAEMDALYGTHLGFLTPRLYAVGANQESGKAAVGLADVTSGSTCIGTAAQGWDTESGWGSPRALLLYEDLTATFVDLSVSATPSPVAPGGTVTIVAQLSNRTTRNPIAGVPIALLFAASDPNGPCAGVWGADNLTSNSTGMVSLAVSVPICFFGAHGTAWVSVTSDGYFGSNSTNVDVNLLGFVPALAGIESFPANIAAFGVIMGIAIAIGIVLGGGRKRVRSAYRPPAPPPSVSSPPPSGRVVATPASPAPSPVPPSQEGPSPPPSE